MNGDVIKQFLVGLGFDIDDAGLAKFNKAIGSATLKVTALYAATNAMATGIAYGISKISQSFEDLGYEYKIIAPAINKALILRQEMFKAYAATGISLTRVVQASVKLNLSIAKTKIALEAIYKSVGSRFFALLTKQSDIFRQKLYQNMPKIQNALEKFVKFIFKSLEAVTQLGLRAWSVLTRVYDFFVMLDKATDGWSTIILGVIAAWRLLNLSFLATPLGMIIAGFVALLALWDDFKTFKEGGESLIDWGDRTVKIVVAITAAIVALGTVIAGIRVAMAAWTAAQWLLNVAMSANPIGAIIIGVTALIALLGVLAAKMGLLNGLGDWLGNAGSKVMDFLGGPNAAANMQNNPVTNPGSSPAGAAGVQNSQTNQHVQQQTSINVMGSADASSVGKAVAGEQSRVNFDMVRNMKGATR